MSQSSKEASFFSGLSDAFVSVVVPVFNEAPRIAENITLLIDELDNSFQQFEIIVISDGSTDGTNLQMFRVQCPEVKIRIFKDNMGKGAVIREGFKEAKGEYILFIDGGMELHPREIRTFLGLMFLYDADIVIGSKRHPQSRIDYPKFRKVLSWIFQKLTHLLFNVDVTDTQVGIKLFRKEVVKDILPYLTIDQYGFDLELLSLAKIKGYKRILEAPVRMDYFAKNHRFIGREYLHVFRIGFSLLRDTLRLYFRLRRLKKAGELVELDRPKRGHPRQT